MYPIPSAETITKADSLIGKSFTPKNEKHFAHGAEFKVIEELDFAFLAGGKKVAAVRFQRVIDGGVTIRKRAEFLAEFTPFTPEK